MMKRLPALFLSFLLLLMTGCAPKTPSAEELRQKASQDFTSEASITYGELKAKIGISRTDGVCTVTLTEPESVQGLEFVFDSESVTVWYEGLSFVLKPDDLPTGAVAGMTVSAVNSVLEPYGVEVGMDTNAVTLTGSSEAGRFLFRMDAQTGSYLSVELPDAGFSAEFENFSFL